MIFKVRDGEYEVTISDNFKIGVRAAFYHEINPNLKYHNELDRLVIRTFKYAVVRYEGGLPSKDDNHPFYSIVETGFDTYEAANDFAWEFCKELNEFYHGEEEQCMDDALARLMEKYNINLSPTDKTLWQPFYIDLLLDEISAHLKSTGLKVVTEEDVQDMKDILYASGFAGAYPFTLQEILTNQVEELKARQDAEVKDA